MLNNSVTLIGNLTRDVEVRYTPGGAAMARFGLAVNRRRKNAADQWEDETSFLNVKVWNEPAEHVADGLKKGDRVIVVGRIEQRGWTTPGGERKSAIEIVAEEVAPSMRWANVAVTKIPRDDGSLVPDDSAAPAVEGEYQEGEEPF